MTHSILAMMNVSTLFPIVIKLEVDIINHAFATIHHVRKAA